MLEMPPGRWLVRHVPDRYAPRDPLTGAYSSLARSRIRPSSHLASIDIAGLMRLNDWYGFVQGDLVIRTVATRLRNALPACRLYRVGGDEFLVEIPSLADETEARALAARIAALAGEPIDGLEAPVGLHIAVDLEPVGRDLEQARRRLDAVQWAAYKDRGSTPGLAIRDVGGVGARPSH